MHRATETGHTTTPSRRSTAEIHVSRIDIRLGAGQTAEGRISEINDKTGRVSERV